MSKELPHPVQLTQLRLRSITAGLPFDMGWPLCLEMKTDDAMETVTLRRVSNGVPDRTVTIPYRDLVLLARLESDHPARAPIAPTPLHVPPNARGKTFDPDKDEVRMGRLLEAVSEVMADGRWRTLLELKVSVKARCTVNATEAGLSARLRDLRKPQYGSRTVERERIPDVPGLWRYRLVPLA